MIWADSIARDSEENWKFELSGVEFVKRRILGHSSFFSPFPPPPPSLPSTLSAGEINCAGSNFTPHFLPPRCVSVCECVSV